ncbi:MAG TPA: septal ring lytic transglycosylase RlpA family protein [Acidobacteriaceae bacterium]|nr:septal ring lytic transglycosylase RlpA family protein [Acidobacteriaceae bacterium]
MEPRLGNERIATMTGRARTAFTLAAMVVLSAFATDNAIPATVRAAEAVPVMHEVTTSEIVTTVRVPKATVLTRIKSGLASWYGDVWQGRRTASGRIFDMNELTAAHKTLPFGSKVKVTDLRNQRSVIVTITDRGAFFPGRVIDLSLAAARQLRMVNTGVDPVRLELLTYQN